MVFKNHLAIGLLKETLDDPFRLFTGVASGAASQGLHALVEETPSRLSRLLARWQHQKFVKLLQTDRLENADGVIRFPIFFIFFIFNSRQSSGAGRGKYFREK
jgi:hypothetical protein